jgi:spermidine/putrescine ABC transporter ATP-binding subunit
MPSVRVDNSQPLTLEERGAPAVPAARELQVRLENLHKKYQDTVAVADLSLDIERGSFVSLLGPSGCGKTTTLRMIAGLVRPTAGRTFIGGQDVTPLPPRQRRLAMVFQQFALFPHMTVAENVGFGLRMRRLTRRERQRRVGAALELVGMSDLAGRYPKHLSGGQQQRVALARAIVVEPQVLLLDEPLSNLDAKLRQRMRDELVALHRRLGITSLYVTHDQEEAMVMSDLIAVMSEGRIVQLGAPRELYERPCSPFVADFIGRTNLLSGNIVEAASDHWLVRVSNGEALSVSRLGQDRRIGSSVDISIRPERIALTPRLEGLPGAENALSGTVESRSYVGSITRYSVRLNDGRILYTEAHNASSSAVIGEGEGVSLAIAADDIVIFAGKGSDA